MTHIFPRIGRVRSTERSSRRYDLYWASQWSHPKWVRLGITSLEEYARHFNCVEGNTTLYALPKPEIVARWYEQTHDDFRFCFKFPATISHQPPCAIATS